MDLQSLSLSLSLMQRTEHNSTLFSIRDCFKKREGVGKRGCFCSISFVVDALKYAIFKSSSLHFFFSLLWSELDVIHEDTPFEDRVSSLRYFLNDQGTTKYKRLFCKWHIIMVRNTRKKCMKYYFNLKKKN